MFWAGTICNGSCQCAGQWFKSVDGLERLRVLCNNCRNYDLSRPGKVAILLNLEAGTAISNRCGQCAMKLGSG